MRKQFIEDPRGGISICRECAYSNMWPEFSDLYNVEKNSKKDFKAACSLGLDANGEKTDCPRYKRSRRKYYWLGFPWKNIDVNERINEDDENLFCLQYYELFDDDFQEYEKDKLKITFVLECAKEYLMTRFGKTNISLEVRYDCKELKIITIDAFASGEKFDCPFNEEDLDTISDKCFKVGLNTGKVSPPTEWSFYVD